MRILHVPYCYYPDAVGGTEVYVASLAGTQRANGVEVCIAAPGETSAAYEFSNIPVRRFAVSPVLDLRELYGEGDAPAADEFAAILDTFHPDVLHIHALTRAVSIRLVSAAKKRAIPVVFHYHTPTVSCSRGTLLRWGTSICDGLLAAPTCASCVLHAHGVPRVIAGPLSRVPAGAGSLLGRAGLFGTLATAVRLPELTALRIRKWHELMEMVDRVVAPSEWVRELLMRNGVSKDRIALSRQGIAYEVSSTRVMRPKATAPVRLAFLGRLDATKGAHVILEALSQIPDWAAGLDLFCVRQSAASNRYVERIEALASRDSRVRILPPVEYDRIVPLLQTYDALLVPSQWLETGPLVVLEAFAAGTPVIGSKLGGVAKLVRHEVDGLLVAPHDSPSAWADALRGIRADPGLLTSMASRIQRPKHVSQAADEIQSIYDGVLQRQLQSAGA